MDFPALEREVFSSFLSMFLHYYNPPERFFQVSSPCFCTSTIYLRGFFKFPLHSQVYQRFLQVFLPTILHPSIYQEIYIYSPQFYNPPRNIDFSQQFYTPQPTMSNPYTQTQEIKSKMKHSTIKKSSQEKEKKSRTNIFKIPPYNLLGPAKFQIKFLINQNIQKSQNLISRLI